MRRTFRRMPLLAAGIARYFDSQSLFKLSLLSCVKTPIASADLGRSEAVRRTSVASFLAYACFESLSARWVLSFCRLSVGSLPDAFRAGRCSRLKACTLARPGGRPTAVQSSSSCSNSKGWELLPWLMIPCRPSLAVLSHIPFPPQAKTIDAVG